MQKDKLSSEIEKELTRSSKITIVNRNKTSELLKEIKFEQLGLTKETKDIFFKSSDAILETKVSSDGNKALLRLNLIFRNGESKAGNSEFALKDLEKGANEAVNDLLCTMDIGETSCKGVTRAGAVWRSALLPGYGQFAKKEKVKGISFMVVGIGLFAFAANSYSNFQSKSNAYDSAQNLNTVFNLASTYYNPIGLVTTLQARSAGDSASKAGEQATIAVAAFGAFYLYNLIDAAFTGKFTTTANLDEPKDGWRMSVIPVNPASYNNTLLGTAQKSQYVQVEYTWRF